MATHCSSQAHPSTGQLLGDVDVAGHRYGGSAVLLGDRQTVDTDALHLVDPRLWVLVGVLHVAHVGLDVPVDEGAHRLDEHALFWIQHGHFFPGLRTPRPMLTPLVFNTN